MYATYISARRGWLISVRSGWLGGEVWARLLDRLRQKRRHVDHTKLRPRPLDAVVKHHRAERTCHRQRVGAGVRRLADALLVDGLAPLLHPHVRSSGAAAERLLAGARHLHRLADARS